MLVVKDAKNDNLNGKGRRMIKSMTYAKTKAGRMTNIMTYATKTTALCAARTHQRRTGIEHYVAWAVDGWEVTTCRPLMGEWYTSGGIRHGG